MGRALITNSYHNEYGRGGYFYPTSGTSEGQSIFIKAAYLCYEALNGGTASEQHAANWYKQTAQDLLDGIGDGSPTGPILRQAFPVSASAVTIPHWLFAARGSVPLQTIVYNYLATRSGNTLTINQAATVFNVWEIYPSTSFLLYQSPYSPAYDSTTPAAQTQVVITSSNWTQSGSVTTVTIPSSAPANITQWYIVYGFYTGATIPRGSAYEAYPAWVQLSSGYSACAPDTFHWWEQALTLAIAHDTRPGKQTQWTNLRASFRQSVVKGQNLGDLRTVLQSLPGFPAIPIQGNDPTGMFCFSNNSDQQPPPINAGYNSAWSGFNFWSRNSSGDLVATVPADVSATEVQIGRGYSGVWRASAVYQDPDQYLFVSLCCTVKPGAGEHLYIFVSATQYYSARYRWYADIGPSIIACTLSGLQDGSGLQQFLIPLSSFTKVDFDNSVLTAGQTFQNYGVSIRIAEAYSARIQTLRPLAGPTQAYVQANLARLIKSGPVAFSPGSMPFVMNFSGSTGQFVGFTGLPFHGYQLPDLWFYLHDAATAVFGSLNVATDLPTSDPSTGAIVYPISATDSLGATKPIEALLMEQQVRLLQAAQNQYVTDGGTLGPFAHTFIVNNDNARQQFGNPTPHTWIYVNSDPNTRWIGYQVRTLESLASLLILTKGVSGFADVYSMAHTLVVNWLTWLNNYWPNLLGSPNRGSPTDYVAPNATAQQPSPSPGSGPPQTNYEEPHGPMIIARACLWLKIADSTQATLCDALMLRCWTYVDSLFVLPGGQFEMIYTWSPIPTQYVWYGFWHGEIITTIADFLKNSSYVAAGIDLTAARLRLVQTQSWLQTIGLRYGP